MIPDNTNNANTIDSAQLDEILNRYNAEKENLQKQIQETEINIGVLEQNIQQMESYILDKYGTINEDDLQKIIKEKEEELNTLLNEI